MPHVFRSRKEFSYWFANPMTNMIEGTSDRNQAVVNRLHGIIRPFVLRRLKKDVETQMPGKFEHIIKCHLSRRQVSESYLLSFLQLRKVYLNLPLPSQMLIYEEFMARSSTRQALRKGGNFMGMMNVLMQLRKVCNHPDLFEPRAVVTPFIVDPITIEVPYFVPGCLQPDAQTDRVDDYLLSPLWSGSQGIPSILYSMKHDRIESEELLEFEHSLPTPVRECENDLEDSDIVPYSMLLMAKELFDRQHAAKVTNVEFLNQLNSDRCSRLPSAITNRLVSAVTVDMEASDHLNSPSHLLSLRKDQLERSKDLSGLIKKFVFCVPKAGAAPPIMNRHNTILSKRSSLEEMLVEPIKQLLLPFQESSAKLSSDFPDKKLIQFDSGKLQILSVLLRERKQGGHKVLIFTQMGKMVSLVTLYLSFMLPI
jgi:SNF2 family DNA or RNA helicase